MVVALLQDQDSIKLLVDLGFTETQAKLYLTLTNTGKTDAKTLAKQANVPRQATYRALGELQEKGLVEKIISLPQEYQAIPLQEGLGIMIKEKATAYAKISENVTEFLHRYETQKTKTTPEQTYQISILEGKDTIINKIKALSENSNATIDVCQTMQRWLHVKQELYDIVAQALERGVKYRAVIECPDGKISIPKEYKPILTHKNYELRIIRDHLKINAAIYDDKIGFFSFYPARAISETPVIITNHPSLLIGFQDHFRKLWQESEKIPPKFY